MHERERLRKRWRVWRDDGLSWERGGWKSQALLRASDPGLGDRPGPGHTLLNAIPDVARGENSPLREKLVLLPSPIRPGPHPGTMNDFRRGGCGQLIRDLTATPALRLVPLSQHESRAKGPGLKASFFLVPNFSSFSLFPHANLGPNPEGH